MVAVLSVFESEGRRDVSAHITFPPNHPAESKWYDEEEINQMAAGVKEDSMKQRATKLAILNHHLDLGFKLITSNKDFVVNDGSEEKETEFYLELPSRGIRQT